MYGTFNHNGGNGLPDLSEREKLEYLSQNFMLLNQEGKEYLENLSRQLLFVQCPNVQPAGAKKGLKSFQDRGRGAKR
jgi:hypothetical protein